MAQSICSINGCERPRWARGWCNTHYIRWRKYGDPLGVAMPKPIRLCSIEGCERTHKGRGLCGTHLWRLKHGGDVSGAIQPRHESASAAFRYRMPTDPPAKGCWLWTGSLLSDDAPYGIVTVGGVRYLAHRISYELFVGPIPDSLIIRHRCDVPQCVQPRHLLPGTQADNVQDKVDRGRQSCGPAHTDARGSRHPAARLCEQDVLQIRAMHRNGLTNRAIASAFGIAPSSVSLIVHRRTWVHI